MVEYIVKEQAFEAILSAIDITGEQWAQVWNKIKQTPPADVVEVVRCKNCAYSDPDCLCSGEVVYKCGYNSDPCLLLNGNHFCSNGRKLKDGEYND